jgi:hypothetical protein
MTTAKQNNYRHTEFSTLHTDESSRSNDDVDDRDGVDDDDHPQHPHTTFSLPSPSLLLLQLSSGFSSLSGSPPELYKAYLLKFLDSYSYFSFSIIFTLFLSEDFGFSDLRAGAVYGACTCSLDDCSTTTLGRPTDWLASL